jgi:hypothetical protein
MLYVLESYRSRRFLAWVAGPRAGDVDGHWSLVDVAAAATIFDDRAAAQAWLGQHPTLSDEWNLIPHHLPTPAERPR